MAKPTRSFPGYARRNGRVGDVRGLNGSTVTVRTHTRSGYTTTWPLDGLTELLEFGSFNPANANYQPGGRPWQPQRARAAA